MNIGIGAEIGDCVYAWPTVRALGARQALNIQRPWVRPNWLGRSKSLKRLAESQDYIDSFGDHKGQQIDIDLTTFRQSGMLYGESIINRVARWARVSVDQSQPWLQVEPSKETKGKIIVSRCPRWKAYAWPYRAIVDLFRDDLLFIGTTEEYRAFCAEFGVINRLLCNDMLDVAQAIAGSELFIGNQSSPFAIAEGLKHPSVLEVCPYAADCYVGRPNCTYSVDGEMEFTALGKTFSSPSVMVQQYRIAVGDRWVYGRSEFECETTARAMYVIKGMIQPTIKQIQQDIEPVQRKAA